MMRNDDFYGYGHGNGGGRGRGCRDGYGLGLGDGFGRGYGLGYGRSYGWRDLSKEELKDFYSYRKRHLEIELDEINKRIEELDKAGE